MGRVTELFHSVVGRPLNGIGCEHVRHHDASARRTHPRHPAQYRRWAGQVVKCVPAQHDGERAATERQGRDVPHLPGHVREPLFALQPDSLLNHGGSQINPGNVRRSSSGGAGDQAGAAGNIQHAVGRADLRRVEQ